MATNPHTEGMDEAASTRWYRGRQMEKAELDHDPKHPYKLKIGASNYIDITEDEFKIIRAILTR